MSNSQNGKGDKPRSCFSKEFREGYDEINWNKSMKKGKTNKKNSIKDALILSEITGRSTQESVELLTAVINSFSKENLSVKEASNRLAVVDANFAESAKQLKTAIEKNGSNNSNIR